MISFLHMVTIFTLCHRRLSCSCPLAVNASQHHPYLSRSLWNGACLFYGSISDSTNYPLPSWHGLAEAPGPIKSQTREIKTLYLRPPPTRRQTLLNETIISRLEPLSLLFHPRAVRREGFNGCGFPIRGPWMTAFQEVRGK